MMYKRAFAAGLAVFLLISAASAQRAEVTISLNEAFFDSLLDSVFQNFDPPEFSMASTDVYRGGAETQSGFGWGSSFWPADSGSLRLSGENPYCNESVKLLREMKGVRTAVKFRDGKIYVPLAFSGNYAPPLIGCVEFAGWAEANLDLEFDQNTQKLVGRVRVYNVNLNGTGGIGGSVIAKLIQGSIDKKLNPIEIMSLDKVSFGVPVQSSGTLRMKAQKIKPEVGAGALNVRVEYEFVKG
ncbi:MAG TPA: hypothetical protein PLP21_13110 [Pyrinomonadaceae bacterium]|nr:hypothetical protein [Acidobacteriota bacterium]HQZ97254.1 hypothetical protein [Pyrinomonadaceae bacterium]